MSDFIVRVSISPFKLFPNWTLSRPNRPLFRPDQGAGRTFCPFKPQMASSRYPIPSKKRKRQIKDGYFLDRLLGIIPLFKEAFSWNQSSLQSISVSISP
ncbi:hypothetical protein, partial [uncultured Allobaculum sp.]|uniref:hypothetical protein n=1 Tax=uncultured Allobaculum sp. TaxID=1187017 RepID=UPI00259386D2